MGSSRVLAFTFYIFIGHTSIIMLDNLPIKTTCSKPCRALTPDICNVPMHVKCDATTWYLLICMHACINIILTKLHVIQLRNKSCNWIFLSRFQTQKNSMHYYHFSHKKTACYQPRISMQTRFFFSRFRAQKNSMNYYHFSHKNCMLSTKNKHANWNFFSRFPAQKNSMHFYPFSHQKLHVINQE